MTDGGTTADGEGGGTPLAGASRPTWVLGADSGGSGLRITLAALTEGGAPQAVGTVTSAEPVRTGAQGIDAEHMLAQLVPAARDLLARAGEQAQDAGLDAVCVGAAGMATLGGQLRAQLPGALTHEFGARRIALAADAVTAYAGALGQLPGAVVAGGTGLIAMGTDLHSWRRADGWGHLLGDCGSGAWIGQAGLQAAMRAYDGREGGSAALRERAEAVFGAPLSGLPAHLYPRTDRPAVLASFAPEVAACAEHDVVAEEILLAAAQEIATAAAAVCPAEEGAAVAVTGGLFRIGEPLLGPLREQLDRRTPQAHLTDPAGDPLDGALLIAARLSSGALHLPQDAGLLSLT
ncbi:N-acetylglucosamine kinase [Streptomyces ovatisporus]|uniref:N-acetylglucosamine kinase n=1 Tax=Streptomyces ovatisporus TaxID=1128682 RepID=A0ABV9A5C8_9ACTN